VAIPPCECQQEWLLPMRDSQWDLCGQRSSTVPACLRILAWSISRSPPLRRPHLQVHYWIIGGGWTGASTHRSLSPMVARVQGFSLVS